MTGGGGIRLANFLYNAAPKDGWCSGPSIAASASSRCSATKPAQFDATRFNWIGSTNDEVSICVAWHTTGIER